MITNSFVYLEFGALPMKYVIHCRQLGFLYHIIALDDLDPVRRMHEYQKLLPYEKNWTNEVIPLIAEYGLSTIDITSVSKDSWKETVKKKVMEKAFIQLTTDISDKSKTKHLQYETFSFQPYMHSFTYKQACIILKLRSHSIDCKDNRKSSNSDRFCRLCKTVDETQSHIINCPKVSVGPVLGLSKLLTANTLIPGDEEIVEICRRIDVFNKLINNSDETILSSENA